MTSSRSCLIFIATLSFALGVRAEIVVEREVIAPLGTNTYLVYDSGTRAAALVDVAGPVDRLLSIVSARNLTVEYLLVTHAHPDHTFGIPAVRAQFPRARLCMSQEEAEDARMYQKWETTLPPKEVEAIRRSPVMLPLMGFDPQTLGATDIVIVDGSTLKLGDTTVRAFFSPGHSRGSVCYLIGRALFSGDVLFYRRVGRSDLVGGGGFDQLVVSVRRLYDSLPADTPVYPGHGKPTDLGSEKRQNLRISATMVSRPR